MINRYPVLDNFYQADALSHYLVGVSEGKQLVTPKVQYWLYAPGENASKWDEFYSSGIMGIGWEDLGDLNNYSSKDERGTLDLYDPDIAQFYLENTLNLLREIQLLFQNDFGLYHEKIRIFKVFGFQYLKF